ncbi:MAG: type II secretion system F family protein [Acidimicrobiales bacterium]
MTALVLSLCAAYGVFLVFTSVALGWTGVGPGPRANRHRLRTSRLTDWLVQAGLGHVRPVELVGALIVLFAVGAVLAWALFGGVLAPLAGGAFAATLPIAGARAQRDRRRTEAAEAWPRLIEELRLKTSALGRSIPQAVFEVGRNAPEELRPAFEAARREWLLSTDFERSLAVLKARLADTTADTVCETLLVAHHIGGTEVDRCLVALVDDRIMDQQGRKDARARQAGARFARRFVLVVPLGMALVGLSIGEGRAAYQSPTGQLLVLAGLVLMGACWIWAGRIMRLPDEQRVFGATSTAKA